MTAPRLKTSQTPRQHQSRRPGRKSLVQLRLHDLRRLVAHRSAFAVESPLAIVLLETLAQHLVQLPGDSRKRIASLIDTEARWYGIERFDDLLERLKERPKYWKSAELGWHLRLTEHERTKLKIRTIEAAGVSPEQRKEINREKRRQKAAERRQEQGTKPRAQWLADHADKPWTKAGMSRRTWYRKRLAQVRYE